MTEKERTLTIELSKEDEDGPRVFDVTDEDGESILGGEIAVYRFTSVEVDLKVIDGEVKVPGASPLPVLDTIRGQVMAAGDPKCETCGTQLELGEGEFVCPECP